MRQGAILAVSYAPIIIIHLWVCQLASANLDLMYAFSIKHKGRATMFLVVVTIRNELGPLSWDQ